MMNSPTSNNRETWLCKPQPKLGASGLIGFIILANTIIPFSIDMYTPAVPSLPGYFNTTEWMVNFTLMGFFLFLTVSSLLIGPISDKLGRKPVLVTSIAVYSIGGALCAIAPTIVALIGARLVQATGAGGIMSVSMALVKDCFVKEQRERIIAIIQVLAVVGPVIAPLVGGFLLRFFSWRASFVTLALLGAICFVFGVLFEESLPKEERNDVGVFSALRGLVTVGRNPSFMVLAITLSLFNVAFTAYLAVASYIYIDTFHTTPQQYTYFFAVTAAFTALGPFIWMRASKKVTPRTFTNAMMVLAFVASFALLAVGKSSVFSFCAAFILFATLQSAIRPYMVNILLSQQEGDTGSASSLINFMVSIFGVAGMSVIVAPWPDYIFGLGAIMLVCAILSCALWIFLLHNPRTHIEEFDK